jgi:hypothetical protein
MMAIESGCLVVDDLEDQKNFENVEIQIDR